LKSDARIDDFKTMTFALDGRKLLPAFIMLVALAGMSLSVIGESFSHGVVELDGDTESEKTSHSDHHDGHSHSFDDEPERSLHHDAGNHTHETVGQLTVPLVTPIFSTLRQPLPFAGDSPRNFCYRLERPPKALPHV
jgi:hypothetical protein